MQCHHAAKFSLRSRSFQGQIPHIFHNSYLHLTKCWEVIVKVKFSSRSTVKVKYLKLFMITNFVMTPCCEVFTNGNVIWRSNTSNTLIIQWHNVMKLTKFKLISNVNVKVIWKSNTSNFSVSLIIYILVHITCQFYARQTKIYFNIHYTPVLPNMRRDSDNVRLSGCTDNRVMA